MRILVQTLAKTDDPASQLNILKGINAALKGRRNVAPPEGWQAVYDKLKTASDEHVREQAQALAVIFGGGGAFDDLRKTLGDSAASVEHRQMALDSLVSARDNGSVPVLLSLIKDAGPLRRTALHGLASFDDAKIPEAVLGVYPGLNSDEKREALSTLVSRPVWARSIVAGLDSKVIARSDVSTPLARQLAELKDPQITEWLNKNWGAMRSSPADKQQQIVRLKSVLTPGFMAKGDASHGRALFSQTCALCHTLFGAGAKIGPELPGAFEDIDYLLLNIIDPNAIIGKDYQQTVIETKDGQTLVGIIAGQDVSSVTLKSLAGVQTVQRSDIKSLNVLDTSLMPEGLLSALKDEDVRDLFSYLRRHGQVPLLLTSTNANDFFNGSDLAHWIPSRVDGWKVENSEIAGKGNSDRPETLTSDMALDNYHLSARMKLEGKGDAKITVLGQNIDGGFQGAAVGFSSAHGVQKIVARVPGDDTATAVPATVKLDDWITIDVVAATPKLTVKINGQPVIDEKDLAFEPRTVFAFSIFGKDATLHLKDVRLEVPSK